MAEGLDDLSWFSYVWFLPGVLKSFSWASELTLLLLAVVPLLIAIKIIFENYGQQKMPTALSRKELREDPTVFFRFIPPFFLGIALALMVVALARPQLSNEKVEQWTEGIDIMLVMDISESMQIQDFEPNRLEAAKDVARNFIGGRMQDRIGLVVFSGEAYSKAPLTTDYDLLNTYIDDVSFDLIENRGTAIGSALAVATNRMRESESLSKVLILLSDGDNTAGNIDPITAARLAQAYNIRIYTIAIGKEGKVPFGKDFFGRPRYVENTLDETNLREIAKIGEGEFYRVSNKQALEEVFARIDEYEKAEIKETRFRDTTDYYSIYLMWGILFFLAWLLTKSTFMVNVLQD